MPRVGRRSAQAQCAILARHHSTEVGGGTVAAAGGVGPGADLDLAAAPRGRRRRRAALVLAESDDEPQPCTQRKRRRVRSATPPRAQRPAEGQAACSSRTVLPPLHVNPDDGHDDDCVVCHWNTKLLICDNCPRSFHASQILSSSVAKCVSQLNR